MHVTALIVAAGSGTRMGGDLPKQYARIGGKAVLAHAVDALLSHSKIDAVRVVIGEGQEDIAREALEWRDVGDFIIGGATRNESTRNGLAAVETSHVLVHDAARPFCPPEVIDRLVETLDGDAVAVVPVLAVADTMARLDDGGLGEAVSRYGLVKVQTPQGFRTEQLLDVLEQSDLAGAAATDEASVIRAAGQSCRPAG